MSILPEIDPVVVRGNVLTSPFPDVDLFFTRYGVTFEDLVEAHVQWTVRTLIPFLNDQVETIDAGRQANLDALELAVNNALAAQASNVNASVQDALSQVIASTIAVTDPVTLAIITATSTNTRELLDNLYALNDQKLLSFINNDPGADPENVRHRLDALYGFKEASVLELLTRATDSPVRNKLDADYARAYTAYWTPAWGGDSGARLGDNGVTEGQWQTADGKVQASCRLVFGSTAIFGGSVLSGANLGGGIDPRFTTGTGLYIPYQNGATRDLRLDAISTSELRVMVDVGAGWVPIGQAGLGNPTQQSVMKIDVSGWNPPA